MLEHLVHDFVEELVERDEVRALDVPVGLFGLKGEIQRVGELLVEQIDGVAADLVRKIVLGGPEWARIHERGSFRDGYAFRNASRSALI